MNDGASTDRYVELLTGCQSRLYGYIYSLTGDADQAREVLQETNRKLWQIRDQYDPSREFLPWAFKVSYNEVRTARKSVQRERLVFHDEETLHVIADAQAEWHARCGDRALALEACLTKLGMEQRELVEAYYSGGSSIESLAKAMNRRANSVAVMLHRIRLSLADCIRRTLAGAPQ